MRYLTNMRAGSRGSRGRHWGIALAALLAGCSDDPGVRPIANAAAGSDASAGNAGATNAAGGSAGLTEAPSPAGGHSVDDGGECFMNLPTPATTIVVTLSPPVDTPLDGSFTACQNDQCVSGLVANLESLTPYQVKVSVSATSLTLFWYDPKLTYEPDVYRLEYLPRGGTHAVTVFSASTLYSVIPTGPDCIGNCYCPPVLFVAYVNLPDPVDLAVGIGNDGGAAGMAGEAAR